MITLADFQKLQAEIDNYKTQLEDLRKVDVADIKAGYDTQIATLKGEIESLKTVEAIQATDAYKAVVAEGEANKAKISELEKSNAALQVSTENNNKLVNTMVMEKLASVGVAPIKTLTVNTPAPKSKAMDVKEYFGQFEKKD